MIMDHLSNLLKYVPKQDRQGIQEFLTQVSPDMEEREYAIDGSRVFARVMSYDTKEKEDCRLEAHNRYIDIQASITGAEEIDVFERKALRIKEEYQPDKDVVYFHQDAQKPYAQNRNIPGMFSMLYPGEAHRPQEKAAGYEDHVKKFVIKMEATKDGYESENNCHDTGAPGFQTHSEKKHPVYGRETVDPISD